jgi:hypothetical protein
MQLNPVSGAVINRDTYVYNGQGYGQLGGMLQHGYDTDLNRPFLFQDQNGRTHRAVMMKTGRTVQNKKTGLLTPEKKPVLIDRLQATQFANPVMNAATMRKEEWIQIDRAVMPPRRERLSAWDDLVSRNTIGGFNAMGKLTYEYQAQNDPMEAIVDMDPVADGRGDRVLFNLRSIPLPVIHCDFHFTARELAVSRNFGTPLDMTSAEACGRRIREKVEDLLLGIEEGTEYGTVTTGAGTHTGLSKIYGYTNFPYRTTKVDLHSPSAANPEQIVEDVLEMMDLMYADKFYGPFILYHTTGYTRFLNDDYFRSGGTSATRTLRERLLQIEGLSAIRRLDRFTSGSQLILVQMTPDVVQAINGMDITTVQWESQGGMRINFKVMAIMVPLLKANYAGETGIVHGTTS